MEAFTLLFGQDWRVRELTEHYYYGSDPQPQDRVELVATITDILAS